MPADLTRTASCLFCGHAGAMRPVGHLASDGMARYVHPTCVAEALEDAPADLVARACASWLGMYGALDRARVATGEPPAAGR